MAELPTMDMAVVGAIKSLMDNIKNDVDMHDCVDQVTDLVDDNELVGKGAYKPLLRSFCDLLREKGFPQTADFLLKQWQL